MSKNLVFSLTIVFFTCAFWPSPAQAATEVDIIFEAETLTPVFYQGRAEPTPGSTVRAVAILNGDVPQGPFSYRWSVDQIVRSGGFALNMDTLRIPIDSSSNVFVSVEVRDSNNQVIAQGNELLELSEQFIAFYEDKPLRGVSRLTIGDTFIMSGDEATFRAEPYFMNRDLFNNQPRLEWDINNQTTKSANQDPLTLTLLKTSAGQGSTRISFYAHNTKMILQFARNGFVVRY